MAITVSFGQYLPGDTFIHGLDARTKLLVAIFLMYALFASRTWWAMAFCALVCLVGYAVARVPPRVALRAIKPLFIILAFTVLANTLTFSASSLPASVSIAGNFGLKPDGFMTGLYYALRIVLLVWAMSLITFTTSAVRMTDAFTSFMRPLRVFHVPVEDIATMFSLAMRMIPVTTEEAQKVTLAQKARGVKFDQGSLLDRVRAWGPVLIPLFAGLFRQADDLADAMEARCYTGVGRTHMHEYVMRPVDWTVLALALAACVVVGIVL